MHTSVTDICEFDRRILHHFPLNCHVPVLRGGYFGVIRIVNINRDSGYDDGFVKYQAVGVGAEELIERQRRSLYRLVAVEPEWLKRKLSTGRSRSRGGCRFRRTRFRKATKIRKCRTVVTVDGNMRNTEPAADHESTLFEAVAEHLKFRTPCES